MSPRASHRAAVVVLLGLAAAGASCKSTAPKAMREPGAAGGASPGTMDDGSMQRDDLGALQAELASAEAQLQGLSEGAVTQEAGEATPDGPTPEPRPHPATTPVDRCTRIQMLADRICELRDRMCTLAAEHPGQPRYEDACEGAEQSCEEARTASDDCE